MIDRGLLVSLALMAVVLTVAGRAAPPRTVPAAALWDLVLPALGAGVFVARVVSVAIEDPGTFATPRDLLIIRGGMSFWAGVGGSALATAWPLRHQARRSEILARLADLAPYGLWAYGTFEVTCLVRDGCFGPPSALGLRPLGLPETQLPVGLAVGLCAVLLGVAVRRLGVRHPTDAVLMALGGLATCRWLAAFWLPDVGVGPSRQQVESLVVALASLLAYITHRVLSRVPDPPITSRDPCP